MEALSFVLKPALCSWSEGGAAEVPTADTPTWSAIVGMLGAALGIERGSPDLVRLSHEYAMALTVKKRGETTFDYHIIQTPLNKSQVEAARGRTRHDELNPEIAKGLVNTITRRQYVQDAEYEMFLVSTVDSPLFSLKRIQAALSNPVYPLTAGRRSCLIGRIHAKETTMAALIDCTHWDARIPLAKPATWTRERRDMLIGNRKYTSRLERISVA